MSIVGVRELKKHLSSYIKEVKEGNTVTVTNRGKAVAYILPVGRKVVMEEVMPLIRKGIVTWSGDKPRGNSHAPVIKGKQTSEIVIGSRR